jgi:sugar/nucleoside kinase (ribokinase family)
VSERLDLVVVGCPSLDKVVLGGLPRDVAGGAAWLTALAAHRAGARVGLVARIPTALPDAIARTFGPGGLDRAGLVPADGSLPSFHIVYDDALEATYVEARAGVERDLCAADLPEAWLDVPLVHVASLGGRTDRQLRFVRELRARGYVGLLSAGTFGRAVQEEPAQVGALLLSTDFFFLNRAEAAAILPEGPPRTHRGVVCVTAGADGAFVHGGGSTRHAPAPPVDSIIDPTGAGDSFCGAFLGATVRGMDGLSAGLAIAAEALSGWGGEPLADAVAAEVGPRAVVDEERVGRVAAALSGQAAGAAFDFCGFPFPERDDPLALEILACSCLHQYGFWQADSGGWLRPMYAEGGGRSWKGSEFVWQAFTRAAASDPTVLDPARMATDEGLLEQICAADDGRCPLPDAASHRSLHRACGAALRDRFPGGWRSIVEQANATDAPVASLLATLATLPGYAEDPLAKKANLLAIMLAGRPEAFLRADDPASIAPIVDYHLMRGCLRTGCVRIVDPELDARLAARGWVDGVEEAAIRAASFDAIRGLVERSGRTMAEVDASFFARGRRVCLEVEPARCDTCGIAEACVGRADLFQPVFRTTAY